MLKKLQYNFNVKIFLFCVNYYKKTVKSEKVKRGGVGKQRKHIKQSLNTNIVEYIAKLRDANY